uniref:Uncharacterized protein n=1 Tax=Timema cristinae TaxID=61476 RepID=A0A7R9CG36_TIMCR|nr:unnamed protein product [Timema cristinae]
MTRRGLISVACILLLSFAVTAQYSDPYIKTRSIANTTFYGSGTHETSTSINISGKQRYYDKMKQNALQPFTYDSRSNQESSRRSPTIQHITQSKEEKQKEEQNNGAQDITQQTTSNTVHHVRRLLLKRDPNDRSVGGNGLGMRVIGGKEIPNSGGKLGTYVTRIYQGGVADKLRVIKEGDRLLEWNGVSLTGKTFEEVQRVVSLSEGKIDIVVESGKPSTSLELSCTGLTSLDKSNYDKIDYNGNKRMLSFEETLNEKHSDEIKKHIRDCGIRTSSSEEREEFEAQTLDTAELHKGEIQLQVCYDKNAQILYVIVKKARNLKCVEGVPPDSLVNVYLLPERINEQQRRTQVLTRTCDPEWNETLVYENVSQDQLISRFLELTVWNYAESTTIKFLGGILIDLTAEEHSAPHQMSWAWSISDSFFWTDSGFLSLNGIALQTRNSVL